MIKEISLLIKDSGVGRIQILEWFLEHFLKPCQLEELESETFEVVNLIVDDKEDLVEVNENTLIRIIAHKIDLLICIDCSPSMRSSEGKVLSSIAFETCIKSLRGLVQPFQILNRFTGKTKIVEPIIRASVIGHSGSLSNGPPMKTIIFNRMIDKDNILEMAKSIYLELIEYENGLISKTNLMDNNLSENKNSLIDVGVQFSDLDSREFFSIILIITDGVSNNSIDISPESNRKILNNFLNVGIVQIGSNNGYSPATSLGMIPNSEGLFFLKEQTNGFFQYSDDLPYIDEDNMDKNLYHELFLQKLINFNLEDDMKFKTLNVYVNRPIDQLRWRPINNNLDSNIETTQEERLFPWSPNSQPPFIALVPCNYRSYKIPKIRFDILWKARINEGFLLSRIKRSKNNSRGIIKYEIVLEYSFALNVKIIYTIKFNTHYSDQIEFSNSRTVKIDINVLANHFFAIFFINAHNIDSQSDVISSAIYEKLIKLHEFLKSIVESDETLQILTQFNCQSAIYLASKLNSNLQNAWSPQIPAPETFEVPNNYWEYLNQSIIIRPHLLINESITIILQSTSTQTNLGARAAKSIKPSFEGQRARYQVASFYLSRFFQNWASISLSQTHYLYWINSQDNIPSGMVILHANSISESLLTLNLQFFSASYETRTKILLNFKKELANVEHLAKNINSGPIYPLYVCKKPIDTMLINYSIAQDTNNIDPITNVNEIFLPNNNISRYLWSRSGWIWLSDIDELDNENGGSLLESCFIGIYNNKVSEGFLRVFENLGSVTFYKEFSEDNIVYGVQFIILYDFDHNFLATEVWIQSKHHTSKIDEIFGKDRLIISQNVAYEFCKNPNNFKTKDQFQVEDFEQVSTKFHYSSLLCDSIFGFLWFQSIGKDDDVLENLIKEFPEKYEFKTKLPNLDECDKIKFQILIDEKYLGKYSKLNVDQDIKNFELKKQVDLILLSCFRNSLQEICDFNFDWPEGGDCPSRDVFKIINQHLDLKFLYIESFQNCSIFIKESEDKCYLLALPKNISLETGVFSSQVIVIYKPENFKGIAALDNRSIVFEKPSQISTMDSSLFLIGKDSEISKNFISEDDLRPWCESIRNIYKLSLVKAIYFSLLSSEKVCVNDLERGLLNLKSIQLKIDMTNVLLISYIHRENLDQIQKSYKEIINEEFTDITNFIPEYQESLLFLKPFSKLLAEDVISGKFSPLFINLSTSYKSNTNCSNALPIEYDEKLKGLEFPYLGNVPLAEFRIKVITTTNVLNEISKEQNRILEKLVFKLKFLFGELILSKVINPKTNFDLNTCGFINKLLVERKWLYAREIKLKFLSEDSIDQFKIEFLNSKILNSKIFCQESDLYYSYSCENQAFWVTIQKADDLNSYWIQSFSLDNSIKLKVESLVEDSLLRSCHKSNQIYLLKELSETHTLRENLDQFKLYFQNYDTVLSHFGCDEQFKKVFPIHWRLKATQVLNNLMSSLQVLSISNRANALVYSSKYYMIFEIYLGSELEISSTDDTKSSDRGILLKVFGLERPGEDIIFDFVKLIDSKIEAMVQNALSNFIFRNPSARLTVADFDFLISSNNSPTYHKTFLLVPELENIHLFLVLLRQSLMIFLNPCLGNSICSHVNKYYEIIYGQKISLEKKRNEPNTFQLGDFCFLYNYISKRNPTSFESKVGEGICTIIITPMDPSNQIMFPSSPIINSLLMNQDVNLDENKFKIISTENDSECKDWKGYKVGLSLWTKGSINLDPLIKRINEAFEFSLIDCAIESYYRTCKWGNIKKPLPSISQNQEKASIIIPLPKVEKVLETLPLVVKKGAEKMNPVLQSISIISNLPLNTIATGVRSILAEEEIQALFFSKDENKTFRILETLVENREDFEYVIVGGNDFFYESLRKHSNASESSNHSDPANTTKEKLLIQNSVDSFVESETESSIKAIDDIEEVYLFPDFFLPAFPMYGKRKTFFIISLCKEQIHICTYNWKKSESDKFFLKLIKVLNWAKINKQFKTRKEWYSLSQVEKLKSTNLSHRMSIVSNNNAMLKLTTTFASKFRELDFIYHIGGFDAIQLQKQIVDYLEIFFRFGKDAKTKGNETFKDYATHLSLNEMSKVLQSSTLIHSSSSPIFFSECCKDLLEKWNQVAQQQKLSPEALLNVANSFKDYSQSLKRIDLNSQEQWFKSLINSYLNLYIEYLQTLGLEKTNVNLPSLESGLKGGAFAINQNTIIIAPSVFLRKYFSTGVLLVQIGFYSFFSTVNVLTFAYNPSTDASETFPENFEQESFKIKITTHIVSFTYDFHLRYIQNMIINNENFPQDLIEMIRIFLSLNPRKARFSRNRVIYGHHHWKEKASNLFRYILKNPTSYGFSRVEHKGLNDAISITTDFLPSGRKDSSKKSDFKFTLILCEDTDSDMQQRLQYFILIIDKFRLYPMPDFDNTPEMIKEIDDEPMKEYLESGYYLHDVESCFSKIIENLIGQGLKDFGRDNLWNQLKEDKNQYTNEWSNLFLDKITQNMVDLKLIDKRIGEILDYKLPFKEIVNHLFIYNQKYARKLNFEDGNKPTVLLIFNPQNQDYLLYFKLIKIKLNWRLDIYAVSREGIRDPIEFEHINQTINNILHFLWQKKF